MGLQGSLRDVRRGQGMQTCPGVEGLVDELQPGARDQSFEGNMRELLPGVLQHGHLAFVTR